MKKFTVERNRKYKKTDRLNSAQSSLKSYPLRVTLYLPPPPLPLQALTSL